MIYIKFKKNLFKKFLKMKKIELNKKMFNYLKAKNFL